MTPPVLVLRRRLSDLFAEASVDGRLEEALSKVVAAKDEMAAPAPAPAAPPASPESPEGLSVVQFFVRQDEMSAMMLEASAGIAGDSSATAIETIVLDEDDFATAMAGTPTASAGTPTAKRRRYMK